MKFNNKTVIVTGGGNGIGRALVLALLKLNAKVIAVDINKAYLDETTLIANDSNLFTYELNITDKQAVYAFKDAVIAQHQSIDAIINNAGIIQPFLKVNDLPFDTIDKVMQVNLYGTLYMIKAFLPHLLTRNEAQIANISSMGGFLPVPGQGLYGASKAAVKLLTEALYAELLDTNVKITIVFPGAVETEITKNSQVTVPLVQTKDQTKKYKALPASQAAQQIIAGLEKNKLYVFVGSDSKFMCRLYRIMPAFATRFIAKQMRALLG